jgi:hypothetical protein
VDPARRLLGAQPDAPRRGPVLRLLHRLCRELVWPLVWVMDLGRRFGAVLLRTEYTLTGACHRRGACCHHVLLEWSPLLDRHPWLARLVLWKMTRFYSFFDRGYVWEVQDGLMARVLGCHALRPDGLCGEHRIRPMICRSYPELPITGRPVLLSGCGFGFARRDGQATPTDADGRPLVQLPRRRVEPPDPG